MRTHSRRRCLWSTSIASPSPPNDPRNTIGRRGIDDVYGAHSNEYILIPLSKPFGSWSGRLQKWISTFALPSQYENAFFLWLKNKEFTLRWFWIYSIQEWIFTKSPSSHANRIIDVWCSIRPILYYSVGVSGMLTCAGPRILSLQLSHYLCVIRDACTVAHIDRKYLGNISNCAIYSEIKKMAPFSKRIKIVNIYLSEVYASMDMHGVNGNNMNIKINVSEKKKTQTQRKDKTW